MTFVYFVVVVAAKVRCTCATCCCCCVCVRVCVRLLAVIIKTAKQQQTVYNICHAQLYACCMQHAAGRPACLSHKALNWQWRETISRHSPTCQTWPVSSQTIWHFMRQLSAAFCLTRPSSWPVAQLRFERSSVSLIVCSSSKQRAATPIWSKQ